MFLPLPPALLLAGHGQKQLGAPGGEQGEVRSRSRAAPGLGTGLFVNPGGCRKSRVLFLLFFFWRRKPPKGRLPVEQRGQDSVAGAVS